MTELFREDADGKYAFDQVLGEVHARHAESRIVPGLDPAKQAKLPADSPAYVYTQQTIDRGSTASAVVIHGVEAGGSANDATMWVILGEPVCGIAVPLWVEAGEMPLGARRSGRFVDQAESMRLKGLLRPFKDAERAEYADLAKLENTNGTGWLDDSRAQGEGHRRKNESIPRHESVRAGKSAIPETGCCRGAGNIQGNQIAGVVFHRSIMTIKLVAAAIIISQREGAPRAAEAGRQPSGLLGVSRRGRRSRARRSRSASRAS